MNRRQKARTAARESYYQPSWMAAVLALAAAVLLAWHGMAKADPIHAMPQFQAIPVPPAGTPSARTPTEDDVTSSPACTDTMDMTPQDVQSSPFDADLVAFHGKAKALRIGASGVCDDSQQLSSV